MRITTGAKVEIKNAFNPGKRGFRGIVEGYGSHGNFVYVSGYRIGVSPSRLSVLPDSSDLDNTEYRKSTDGFAK